MPRSARKKSPSGIYHVMLRGINRQSIFIDDEDNIRFLQILKECKKLSGFELYGYCLMGNHIHLLQKETEESTGQIVKRFASRYVLWFNRKYQRCGHLFQERYKSEAVESDAYFASVLRYIHQNPKKAGICDSIREYRWSSYNEYAGESRIIDGELALGIIGESKFEEFMEEEDRSNDIMEYVGQKRILTDSELIMEIEDMIGIKAIMIQNEPRDKAENICRSILKIEGVSTRQLSRVTGVSKNIIWRL